MSEIKRLSVGLSLILIFLWGVAGVLEGSAKMLVALPVTIYLVLGLATASYQKLEPRQVEQEYRDKHQAMSLTLAGFSFTSLSLLIGFFKEEIKSAQPQPRGILFFFALSLAFFVASYLALRYRTKHLWFLVSDAAIDSGFWCILLGVWVFCNETLGLRSITPLFLTLLTAFLIYLLVHVFFMLAFAHRFVDSLKNGHS